MVLADHKTHQTGMPRRDFNEAAEEGWIQAAQLGSVPCLWAKLSVLLFLQDVCMAPGLAHQFDRTSLVYGWRNTFFSQKCMGPKVVSVMYLTVCLTPTWTWSQWLQGHGHTLVVSTGTSVISLGRILHTACLVVCISQFLIKAKNIDPGCKTKLLGEL